MKPSTLLLSILLVFSAAYAEPPVDRVVLPDTAVPTAYTLAIVPDAAAKTFSGTVAVSLQVTKPTNDIVLNAAGLSFQMAQLSGREDAPQIAFDAENETATLHFAKPVVPGDYTLVIAYTGKINDSAAGFFALDYDAESGPKRALFTQFENSDARRFLPCWDEPGIKAAFTLSVVLPEGEMAVSNMPVASETPLPGDRKRVKFQTTPRMSSYLLFYAQGDFERITRQVGDVEIGVVVKRGDTAKAQYALNAAAEILPYYNEYFGTPYPLPKLDLVAGPGQSQFFGAMENWGAIFFFEDELLADPRLTNAADLRRITIVIAHEMAHMWFGDLVTMAWWDDLWLNEGFASWMEYKAADHLHPEWKAWLSAIFSKEVALGSDARAGTHPIVRPIRDVLQASQAFDEITYQKGSAVIRMLEDYLGEEAFREGVRAYMKKYAYGNTVTGDLWAELERASGRTLSGITRDFTLQSGEPLIKVSRTRTGLLLTQSRFAVDDSIRLPIIWDVPVTIKGLDGRLIWRGIVGAKPVAVPVPGKTVAIVNAGQAGYFRTLYDAKLFARRAARFAALTPYDQLGLLNDTAALSAAGFEPVGDALALVSKASPRLDPKVQGRIVAYVSRLLVSLQGLPGEARARAYGDAVLKPLLARLGWDAKPGEDGNIGILRNQLIGALGREVADPGVIAEARRRFAAFLADPQSLSGELRNTVLGIVAYHADAADWQKLYDLAKAAGTSMERDDFYERLAQAKDASLAQKVLDLALGDAALTTLRPGMVGEVARLHPDLAFDFAVAHMEAFDPLLEPTSRNQFYLRLAAASYDTAMPQKLDAFAAAHVPASARPLTVKIKAVIAQTLKWRGEIAPKLDAWLAKKCKSGRQGPVCRKG